MSGIWDHSLFSQSLHAAHQELFKATAAGHAEIRVEIALESHGRAAYLHMQLGSWAHKEVYHGLEDPEDR